jgi:hypothetical protein
MVDDIITEITELANNCLGKYIHQVNKQIFKTYHYDVVFQGRNSKDGNDYLFTVIFYYDDISRMITDLKIIHEDNCAEDLGLFD